MERDEFLKIIGRYCLEYPSDKRFKDDKVIESWYDHFGGFTYTEVFSALMSFVENDISGFPPSVGQLMYEIRKVYEVDDNSESEAWSKVLLALRNSTYGAEEGFAAFDAATKSAVGSPAVMRQWAMMDTPELSVAEAQFRRTYRAAKAREKQVQLMALDYRRRSMKGIDYAATMQGLPQKGDRLPWEVRKVSAVPLAARYSQPEESNGKAHGQ